MEYTVNKLAKMSGVSARTLRYYDEIGLLKPARVAASGYRFYRQTQVDMLQQVLFYKELGFSLEDIKKLLSAPDFDRQRAFEDHLAALQEKRERFETLILNVTKSLTALKGEITMSDQEKFEGFKQKLLNDNEQRYGDEIRTKYGDALVDETYAKLKGLTKEQYAKSERLRLEFEKTLKAAFDTEDPAGTLAQKACDLHKQWLLVFYPRYSKEYHLGLGEIYVADERFRANYDKIAPGCTEFLRDAINIYCR
ncbi:MAG: MerR family transcriptional regulator [Firmicutes bacterium]|nr:MerR family transcriptional regulator [Bacillota bacterium]